MSFESEKRQYVCVGFGDVIVAKTSNTVFGIAGTKSAAQMASWRTGSHHHSQWYPIDLFQLMAQYMDFLFAEELLGGLDIVQREVTRAVQDLNLEWLEKRHRDIS